MRHTSRKSPPIRRRTPTKKVALTTTARPSVNGDITFYRANEKPFGAFSNLYRREIIFEGRSFPTAEHAYQAGKARKKAVREWLLSAPSPSLVAMAAHGLYRWDILPKWSQLKYARMRLVLHAKFTQHHDLRALLLSTRTARLVEAGRMDTQVNRTWGEVNGKGRNMLGIMLMELRDRLLKESVAPSNGSLGAKRHRKHERPGH